MSTIPDVWLPNDGRSSLASLVGLTIGSLCVFHLMPITLRRHMARIATYAHEVSHGVMSLATGGAFHRFHVTTWGGVAITSGGNHKAVVAAGYVGTMVLAALLLAASAQSDNLLLLMRIMALLLALSTLKAGDIQTAFLGVATSKVVALSTTLTFIPAAPRFVSNLLGVLLMWEGMRALWTLLVLSATTTGTNSDAEALARMSGRSPLYWAVVLTGVGIVCALVIIGFAIGHNVD